MTAKTAHSAIIIIKTRPVKRLTMVYCSTQGHMIAWPCRIGGERGPMVNTSTTDIKSLIEQAKVNEQILQRLDKVEEFLLRPMSLDTFLAEICEKIADIYNLDAVSLALSSEHDGLARALEGRRPPAGCFMCPRGELRLLVADLERPLLTNRVSADALEFLFGHSRKIASIAVLPLWARGMWLGSLNMGSIQEDRYHRGLETHFIDKLARKLSVSLEAALAHEQNRLMERREAVMEMAGAACHELAQPLTSLIIKMETMLRELPPSDPLRGQMEDLRDEMERVGQMVQSISEVKEYVTRPYAQGMKIIDLQAAKAAADET